MLQLVHHFHNFVDRLFTQRDADSPFLRSENSSLASSSFRSPGEQDVSVLQEGFMAEKPGRLANRLLSKAVRYSAGLSVLLA